MFLRRRQGKAGDGLRGTGVVPQPDSQVDKKDHQGTENVPTGDDTGTKVHADTRTKGDDGLEAAAAFPPR